MRMSLNQVLGEARVAAGHGPPYNSHRRSDRRCHLSSNPSSTTRTFRSPRRCFETRHRRSSAAGRRDPVPLDAQAGSRTEGAALRRVGRRALLDGRPGSQAHRMPSAGGREFSAARRCFWRRDVGASQLGRAYRRSCRPLAVAGPRERTLTDRGKGSAVSRRARTLRKRSCA